MYPANGADLALTQKLYEHFGNHNDASQPVGMSEVAILNQRARRPFGASEVWLRRAAQARRIARMLSVADAAILDAYAIECEAEARIAEQKLPIAA